MRVLGAMSQSLNTPTNSHGIEGYGKLPQYLDYLSRYCVLPQIAKVTEILPQHPVPWLFVQVSWVFCYLGYYARLRRVIWLLYAVGDCDNLVVGDTVPTSRTPRAW